MRFTDRQKKDIADFKQLLPLIKKLILKVQLTSNPKIYHINNIDFVIRLNGDILEIAAADEAAIFPTLAYRELSKNKFND